MLSDNLIIGLDLENVNDGTGTYNFTNVNSATFAAGKVGNGAVFNGSNQYLYNTNNLDWSTFDHTICCWVKFDTVASNQCLIAKNNDGNFGLDRQFAIIFDTSNGIGVNKFSESNPGYGGNVIYDATSISADVWYFVCVTYDSGSYVHSISVNDNTPTNDAVGQMNTGITATNVNVTLGRQDYFGDYRYLNGMLDSVFIWNRKLGSDEITTVYNSGNGLSYAELIAIGAAPIATLVQNYYTHLMRGLQ